MKVELRLLRCRLITALVIANTEKVLLVFWHILRKFDRLVYHSFGLK